MTSFTTYKPPRPLVFHVKSTPGGDTTCTQQARLWLSLGRRQRHPRACPLETADLVGIRGYCRETLEV